MTIDRYPTEILGEDNDNGTMPENVEILQDAVIGHRIVKVEEAEITHDPYGSGRYERTETATVITLDNGKQVGLIGNDDCCAYTYLESFLLHPELIDHAILGIGTTDEYSTWHIYCDLGDILELTVGWSPGNPFYYGYGFTIIVEDL